MPRNLLFALAALFFASTSYAWSGSVGQQSKQVTLPVQAIRQQLFAVTSVNTLQLPHKNTAEYFYPQYAEVVVQKPVVPAAVGSVTALTTPLETPFPQSVTPQSKGLDVSNPDTSGVDMADRNNEGEVSPSPTPTPQPVATPTPTPTPKPVVAQLPPHELDALFQKYGAEHGVSWEDLKNIARCESGFRAGVTSANGKYGGMYQYLASTWSATRNQMGLDPNPELRFNAEEAIRTTAWKIAHGGRGAWPVCGS
ncbi:transglycosylase family protein [Candidatus Woesebacteria bacterium]|nr:transglycosylase family protein [Candidatus Woesebacteria bacterium]